jgi:hypothetical protein
LSKYRPEIYLRCGLHEAALEADPAAVACVLFAHALLFAHAPLKDLSCHHCKDAQIIHVEGERTGSRSLARIRFCHCRSGMKVCRGDVPG